MRVADELVAAALTAEGRRRCCFERHFSRHLGDDEAAAVAAALGRVLDAVRAAGRADHGSGASGAHR